MKIARSDRSVNVGKRMMSLDLQAVIPERGVRPSSYH